MVEGSPSFDEIIRNNFSEAEIAELPKFPVPQDTELDEQAERDRAERLYHASMDPGIADCLLFGDVEIDQLVARLESDYDLTEQEARRLIDDVGYQTREIFDYDDEA
ncbi:MAG TPA: hypothetical protein VFK97_02850 [Candidatus Saccharimonadales bacterium]|nr:hypothetical protein [Candidatus Saccharimonadales bacterium]